MPRKSTPKGLVLFLTLAAACRVWLEPVVRTEVSWPILADARAGMNEIWAPHGVEVDWTPGRPSAIGTCDSWLRVLIDEDGRPRGPGTTVATNVASLTFLAPGVPRNVIYLSMRGVRWVLADARLTDRPVALQQQGRARVIGRALAHEIGHYLLKSTAHARTGLMRARLSTADLVAVPSEALRLGAIDAQRVAEGLIIAPSEGSGSCAGCSEAHLLRSRPPR